MTTLSKSLSAAFLYICIIVLCLKAVSADTGDLEPSTKSVAQLTVSLDSLGESNSNKLLDECSSCVAVVTIVEDFIKSNQSLEYIIDLVSKICPFLDEDVRVVCPMMIRTMTPEVIGAFLERENPVEVCSVMHLCEGEASKQFVKEALRQLANTDHDGQQQHAASLAARSISLLKTRLKGARNDKLVKKQPDQ